MVRIKKSEPEKIIKWEWHDDHKWNSYTKEHEQIIENGFQEKKFKIQLRIYGNLYNIFYKEMKQQNNSSKFKRTIRRNVKVLKNIFKMSRFLTHTSTDKLIYKLGNTVYVSGVLLSPVDQKPLNPNLYQQDPNFWLGAEFQILGPKGDVVFNRKADKYADSVLSAFWNIPKDTAGGNYKAKFVFKGNGLPESSVRKFEVRAFQNPRLNSQIEFLRKGFGVGDKVIAKLNVKRAEGGIPKGAKIQATARVDGLEVFRGNYKLNDKGDCLIFFNLPKEIKEGEGTLVCKIDDSGVIESASKTIPILINTLDVRMYPEGGDLVNGLLNRLYIEAFTPQGEPADLIGNVVNEKGEKITKILTAHEGRGKCSFTPKKNEKYFIKVTKPTGVKNIALPIAKNEGVSLMSGENIFEADEVVKFKLGSTEKGKYLVTISKREKQLSRVNVTIKEDGTSSDCVLTLPTNVNADGVLRVTVSKGKKPLAERLIYRKEIKKIDIQIKQDYKSYCPGDKCKVRLYTSIKVDENEMSDNDSDDEKATAAVACITVTDESVTQSIDKRKHHPRLNTMVYLESEVDHLDDATIYLSDKKMAPLAMDLLLGTQGWRRFAYGAYSSSKDILAFIQKYKEKGEKFAAIHRGQDKPSHIYENPTWIKQVPRKLKPKSNFRPIYEDIVFNDVETTFSFASQSSMFSAPMKNSLPPGFGGRNLRHKSKKKSEVKSPQAISGLLDAVRSMKSRKLKRGAVLQREQKQEISMDRPTLDALISTTSHIRESEEDKDDGSDSDGWGEEKEEEKEDLQRRATGGSSSIIEYLLDEDNSSLPTTSSVFSQAKSQDIIRVYAHKKPDTKEDGIRTDFTETLYWNAGIKTNKEGRSMFEFDLSDSITSYRIHVDCFNQDGIIGSKSILINCKEPFYMEPKIPVEVSDGDLIKMPVALINNSTDDLKVQLGYKSTKTLIVNTKSFYGKFFDAKKKKKISVESESRKRMILEIKIKKGSVGGKQLLELSGKAGPHKDTVKRDVVVVPFGFPINQSFAEFIQGGRSVVLDVDLPKNIVGLKALLKFYSTSLTSLEGSLASLMKEPYGCFEQTSSTTFPTIMAHQYFMNHENEIPISKIKQSYKLIDKGYKRLIKFECKDGGFEWFGHGSGHEGLSAMGLNEFNEMSKIYEVDKDIIKRTKDWLLARRVGDGTFAPNKAKSYQFGGYAPEYVKVAYIVYSLSETQKYIKPDDIKKELLVIVKEVRTNHTQDGYSMALCGNALYNVKNLKDARTVANSLVKLQKKNGCIPCETTITGSGGASKLIESTSLAILCWLNEPQSFMAQIQKGVNFIHSNQKYGRYGNSQATVLALKAICRYEEKILSKNSSPIRSGLAIITIDDEHKFNLPIIVGRFDFNSLKKEEEINGKITELLKGGGKHKIKILLTDGCSLPYSLNLDYKSEKPENDQNCVLGLKVNLSDEAIEEGEGSEILVELMNKTDKKQGMCMAIIGLPGGLDPRHEQLKQIVKMGTIDCYEINGREVVIYKKGLSPNQILKFKIDVIARVPGQYTGPASRAYLYYTDEYKNWIKPLTCEISESDQ